MKLAAAPSSILLYLETAFLHGSRRSWVKRRELFHGVRVSHGVRPRDPSGFVRSASRYVWGYLAVHP